MQASREECSRQRDQKVHSVRAGMSWFDGGKRLEQIEGWAVVQGDSRGGGQVMARLVGPGQEGFRFIQKELRKEMERLVDAVTVVWPSGQWCPGYHPSLPGRPAVLCHPQDKPPLSL